MLVRLFGKLDGKNYERIIPHRRCEPEDYDRFAPPADESLALFEKYKQDANRNLFCIDWDELGDELDIYGNWQDASKYQRLEFVLTPCNYVHKKHGWDGDFVPNGCIEDLQQ